MKRLNKKGFTMAELLIVVAIIAVLVAIAIPVFTGQLDKSKRATAAANLRAAYAEATAAYLNETDSGNADYTDGSNAVKVKNVDIPIDLAANSNEAKALSFGVPTGGFTKADNADITFTFNSDGTVTAAQ